MVKRFREWQCKWFGHDLKLVWVSRRPSTATNMFCARCKQNFYEIF